MTRDEAILALQEHRNKITTEFRGDEAWTSALWDMLGLMYGVGSLQTNDMSWKSAPKDIEYLLKKIDHTIDSIRTMGIPNEYKKSNFLSDLSNKSLISWLGGAFVVIISGSFALGQMFSGFNNTELRLDIRNYKDSLSVFKSLYQNSTNKTYHKGGTTNNDNTSHSTEINVIENKVRK